ncbi:hypothetical protein [Herbaspirillum huttiense]|uniref:hypothetical protein n=1 Tax=Herbaspirillum huttiense TaxID=863372 RepID=UPI002E7A06EC|nr:hypothetical protein [Herbaspirillum huttiense]MEE1636327.1 hypothetical protein [Herbaspirillum huttiense NC40101]
MNLPSAHYVNGDYHLNPAAVLILIAGTVYGDPRECGPAGYARATHALDSILADAAKCGFTESDKFRIMVARDASDRRIAPLAAAAVSAIEEKDSWVAALTRAGFAISLVNCPTA